jgi:hypothetical protein
MGNDEVCYDVITGYYLDGKYVSTGLNSATYKTYGRVLVVLRP